MKGFTLGRAIDFRHATNRFIAGLSAGLGLLFFALSGDPGRGFTAAGGAFLAWALAREFDPAHEWEAFVPVVLILPALFLGAGFQLGVLFFLLLSMRLLSGICGRVPGALDAVALAGLVLYATRGQQNAGMLFVLGPLFGLAAYRYRETGQTRLLFIASAAVFSLAGGGLVAAGRASLVTPNAEGLALLGGMVLSGSVLIAMGRNDQVPDDQSRPLANRWVALSQGFYLVSAASCFWLLPLRIGTSVVLFAVPFGLAAGRFIRTSLSRGRRA